MRARGRLEAGAHRRAAAAAEEGFGPCCPPAAARRGPPPPRPRPSSASALRRRRARLGSSPAARRDDGCPASRSSCRRSPSRRISSFSHGTDPNPVGDMLSPKIGVTVIVYSPSEGNTCFCEHAAARAERQPFDVVVLRRVFGRSVDDEAWRRRLADRQPADLSGGLHIRLDERRRDAERAGDVVEPVRRIVRRKIRARIDRRDRGHRGSRWRTRCDSSDEGRAAGRRRRRSRSSSFSSQVMKPS